MTTDERERLGKLALEAACPECLWENGTDVARESFRKAAAAVAGDVATRAVRICRDIASQQQTTGYRLTASECAAAIASMLHTEDRT